uniref:Uncharacterized protein n=1 Tax=Candidatus Kentrum sp. LPFa TaxID=2126335 RepID=A0A450WDY0_9GAMM|nr:MAG: hypothetical protein BECKLPF1236B_GA0070989_10745 [Candidatus Kentron sp. LPFa]
MLLLFPRACVGTGEGPRLERFPLITVKIFEAIKKFPIPAMPIRVIIQEQPI